MTKYHTQIWAGIAAFAVSSCLFHGISWVPVLLICLAVYNLYRKPVKR